ncbi:DUF4091 domain-containing protein [Sphingobacterium griseoflavum]|uniref:Glycoside hydrolase 123 C-terminal domain-containing protein n=1 Tax=Sphingobacterium griseoflavum TaxID=1474952 RepID=A0ABQ3HT41_9SPHI|nr:DUF4091 domain-containing protein [Sphingobacterium griseoflavum]GHE31050.1 hypothetical protein GCM10017764_12620 [Sphingobacterium griseoflavum]
MGNFSIKNYFLLCCLLICLLPAVAQVPQPLAHEFRELPDPTKDTLADWTAVANGLQRSFVTVDKRFAKSLPPAIVVMEEESLTGWRGERLSAQLLLWATEDMPETTLQISDLRADDGALLPSDVITARFVRYVMTDEFAGGCGHRKPEDFASSLVADMLDDCKSYDIEARTARPVWITVRIPAEAKPGRYTGEISINTAGQHVKPLRLHVHVLDQLLPEASAWTYHLDQWQHPAAVARVSGTELWSDAHFEALKPVMQLLADAGQKVITTTLNKDPWNVQTYDPYADMIKWVKNTDGSWSYDYTVFDRWVQFMLDLGINKMINCYSIVPWNNEIHYSDQKSKKMVNVSAKPGTAIFEELWTPFLTDFVKHLRAKGWLDRTNIATDERSREEMDAAFALLKKVCPELGVSYADNQKTYQRYPASDDISIAFGHPFSDEDLQRRQSRGLNTTFYICCSDGFPNQFTFSDPAESTYLAWYAEAAGFDGMLRWAFNSWVENPLQDSRFRTWPAGDTYVVYPGGRSSIRYERMLEGVQDYEKIQLVKAQLSRAHRQAERTRLLDAIQRLNQVQRTPSWNADLNMAKKLLNQLSAELPVEK